MILFRIREAGDEEWTELRLDGELELDLEHPLADVLGGNSRWHLQRRDEDSGEWEDWDED